MNFIVSRVMEIYCNVYRVIADELYYDFTITENDTREILRIAHIFF